ncbi:type II secretory pathway, component PulF [Russula earlei]|uniref:Type II secretory pathway, component PulF n=1 Tax=Russula earlei TaxID=71964 RepID=A0ACC0TTV6_9AGAM|nr:type II secretory pathway, component PulF [Russula earlei]
MSESINISKLQRKQAPVQEQPEQPGVASGNAIANLLTKEITLFSNPLPDKIKEAFYLELSSLLEAGLDMRTSLELVRNEYKKKKYYTIFDEVLGLIVTGSSLSAALQHNKCFTPYEFFSIQVGEESGRLNIVLKQLSAYYKSKIVQRRQIVSALTYPSIVLVVAFSAIFFMMDYVVPMFSDVFKRFGGQLPYLTRTVLAFSNGMRKYIGVFVVGIIAWVAFIVSYRKRDWFRKYYSLLILRLPFVKELVLKIYLSRFATTMSLLTAAKVPLVQAIELTRQMMNFYPVQAALAQIENDIMTGLSLHASMELQKIFPSKVVTLVKVGEEVNQLELFFGKIAEQYTGDVEYQTEQLGFVLVAMYLPLFSIGETIK